jgi:hypothetical protein
MWTILAKLLTGPIISGAINAYKAKLESGNTSERIAADLAGRELAVQEREVQAQSQLKVAQIGRAWEPEKLFAYIIVIYFGKLVIWDKVIGSFVGYTDNIFRTDPLTGEAVGWAAMVMAFYFGKRGIENVARILKR